MNQADLVECQALLAAGSKSFSAASLLLPRWMRAPTAALYAFCRVTDDAVDEAPPGGEAAALADCRARLAAAYAGNPWQNPVDRAFSSTVAEHRIPRALPEALLEGYAWDVAGRRYDSLADLEAYCVRVASSVGLMMTLIMGARAPAVLARAADLGVAMQLTNIARDIGADARMGRVYLPLDWLGEEGIDPEALLASPAHSPALGRLVARLLRHAETHYVLADRGIPGLPRSCRLAIRAARLIYSDIGRVIAEADHDAVSRRASTSGPRKLWLLLRALPALLWTGPVDDAPPVAAAAALIASADP